MTTVSLNTRITPELKSTLQQYAEANSLTISAATESLLLAALESAEKPDALSAKAIDSQNTKEETQPLSAKEINMLRKLLKRKK